MGTVRDFDFQSQLAFASYAGLARGVPDVDALRAPGMSTNQAAQFSSKWSVVDQYNPFNGLSATVFQNADDGRRYLAIRGTELTSATAAALRDQTGSESCSRRTKVLDTAEPTQFALSYESLLVGWLRSALRCWSAGHLAL